MGKVFNYQEFKDRKDSDSKNLSPNEDFFSRINRIRRSIDEINRMMKKIKEGENNRENENL